jgi:type III secretion protein J
LVACHTRVHGGLDEAEANEIQTLLIENGFDARKVFEPGKKPTWGIEVEDDRSNDAVRVLTELGLPKKRLSGFDAVQPGLLATPAQERLNELHALSDEVALTLQSVAGVTLARVHLVIPPPPRPGQPPGQPKAAAMVRVRPGQGQRIKSMEDSLKALIAGSVEGLSAEDVSLVLDEVPVRSPPVEGSPAQGLRFRYVFVGLGALVSVLALLLVGVALRMRSRQGRLAPVGAGS